MPDKYHIKTQPVPARRPRIGKCGVVDWREDCANCHNCVKKACVFDRYRQEADYIRGLTEMDAFFFQCMGCFSCVQQCTKGLLALSENPVYERLGNRYWTPAIIETTWAQAETAKIPVSGAGYRGKFSGPGFDSMWTDMSEIVRPTRDGIHGREYISTGVDIGRKLPVLHFSKDGQIKMPPLVDIPMPMMIDVLPKEYSLPQLLPVFKAVAAATGIIMIADSKDIGLLGNELEQYLPNIAFYFASGAPLLHKDILRKTRLAEISDDDKTDQRIKELKNINPDMVVAVRVTLDAAGVKRAIELAHRPHMEAIHVVADMNGDEIGAKNPRFVKDMVRQIHNPLVADGIRNEVTLIAGGGIALPEHMAKQLLCGADLVTINLPLLIALECHLCRVCDVSRCPARLDEMDEKYAVGRMINLIAAWHDQLIEVMGAMGIRDARRLRGEAGRALFFEELEEATFGKIFGSRKNR
ncbi:MAG: glutamate synthase-related protein [Dehalococcoidia bacterium]|jgi:ferredoxin